MQNIGYSLATVSTPAFQTTFRNVVANTVGVAVNSVVLGTPTAGLFAGVDMPYTINGLAIPSPGTTHPVACCTLMTPVFGFVSNAFSNLKDTFEFDMVGEDNVVYRALGRHTNISYNAMLDYHVPSSNFRVNDFGVTSCLNVTLADRWSVKNACLKKQPGQPEVDVSFDIPSFDGTSGSYLGMSSAFTWTYAALSNNPTMMPTTGFPSISPTMTPTQPTIAPSFAPSATPTFAPTTTPTTTPSIAPTITPTVAHTVALFVIQVRSSLFFVCFLPIVDQCFPSFLFHRRSEVSPKMMPLAALPLPRPLQMLWSR